MKIENMKIEIVHDSKDERNNVKFEKRFEGLKKTHDFVQGLAYGKQRMTLNGDRAVVSSVVTKFERFNSDCEPTLLHCTIELKKEL